MLSHTYTFQRADHDFGPVHMSRGQVEKYNLIDPSHPPYRVKAVQCSEIALAKYPHLLLPYSIHAVTDVLASRRETSGLTGEGHKGRLNDLRRDHDPITQLRLKR